MSTQSRKTRRHWRRTINKVRLTVKLTNLDGDAFGVLAEVHGWGAHEWARWDQTIAGSSWETPRDMPGYACATLTNYPGLVKELRAEGYDLNLRAYSEPDFEVYGEAC